MAAEFLFAPYTYQYEKDFHKGVKNPFTSIEIQNGYFSKFKVGLSAGIKLNEKLSVNIFSQILFGTKDKGDFYSNYYTEKITKFEDQQSGTNIFAFKCGISTSYLFFWIKNQVFSFKEPDADNSHYNKDRRKNCFRSYIWIWMKMKNRVKQT